MKEKFELPDPNMDKKMKIFKNNKDLEANKDSRILESYYSTKNEK